MTLPDQLRMKLSMPLPVLPGVCLSEVPAPGELRSCCSCVVVGGGVCNKRTVACTAKPRANPQGPRWHEAPAPLHASFFLRPPKRTFVKAVQLHPQSRHRLLTCRGLTGAGDWAAVREAPRRTSRRRRASGTASGSGDTA
jgi:hypothetical protein